MPIQKRWTPYTRTNMEKIPKGICGMYEIADKNKELIYRGSSDSKNGVRLRLITHLINRKFPSAKYFRYSEAGFLDSGLSMEARHTRRTGKPKRMKRAPIERDILGFRL